MSLADELLRPLTELEDDLDNSMFTWKGAQVPCVPGALSRGTTLETGGFAVDIDMILIVRWDQFLSVDSTLVTIDSDLFTMDNDKPQPVAGKFLLYEGRKYIIVSAQRAATKSHVELTLKDPNR